MRENTTQILPSAMYNWFFVFFKAHRYGTITQRPQADLLMWKETNKAYDNVRSF